MTEPTEVSVDIGIFAHNEQSRIKNFISEISNQSIFYNKNFNINVYVLANGCKDQTECFCLESISILNSELRTKFFLKSLDKSGKSRTWNDFTHNISRKNTNYLFFVDADIDIIEKFTMEKMMGFLFRYKEPVVFASRPIKDIIQYKKTSSLMGRLIAKAGGTLDDQETALAGSLYLLRADIARTVFMPVGLPVEDGFLRAMLLTDLLSHDEDMKRIRTDPSITHVYESLQSVAALVRHQTRIVIGSAINAVLFSYIRRNTRSAAEASALLREASADEAWLGARISEELPRWPFGYVPFHFLTKRLRKFARDGFSLKRLPIVALGFAFDAVVYVIASVKMARGSGSGFW